MTAERKRNPQLLWFIVGVCLLLECHICAGGPTASEVKAQARMLRRLSGVFTSRIRSRLERLSSEAAASDREADSELSNQFHAVEERLAGVRDQLQSNFSDAVAGLFGEENDSRSSKISGITLPTKADLELRAGWWTYARAASRAGRDAARNDQHRRSIIAMLDSYMSGLYLQDCQLRWKDKGKVLLRPLPERSWPEDLAEFFDDCVTDYVALIQRLGEVGDWPIAERRLRELNSLHFLEYGSPKLVHVQLPRLRAMPFWSMHDLKQESLRNGLEELASKTSTIQAEIKAFSFGTGAWKAVSGSLADQGSWPSVKLHAGGKFNDEGCEALPLTCKILREHLGRFLDRSLPSANWPQDFERPYLSASVYGLPAGSSLKLHVGQPGRLAVHLPLQVPSTRCCVLEVGGQETHHAEGKLVLFDDAFLHRVANSHSTTPRIVLGMFIWHNDAVPAESESTSEL